MEKTKYIHNRKVFIPALILIILLFSYVIYIEGWSIFLTRQTIVCPNTTQYGRTNCEKIFLGNGTTLQLNAGEKYEINPHNQRNIDLLNYGSALILIIAYLINHKLYNKEYRLKEKITNLFNKLKETIKEEGEKK